MASTGMSKTNQPNAQVGIRVIWYLIILQGLNSAYNVRFYIGTSTHTLTVPQVSTGYLVTHT